MAPSVAEISIDKDITTAVTTDVSKAASPNDKKNVVIIGGSCVGIAAMLIAKKSLPSTHRLIIIEKHSHFHYMFAFPRASVIAGWENELFIPYTNTFKDAPEKGQVIQALATNITKTHVYLDRVVDGFEVVQGAEQGSTEEAKDGIVQEGGATASSSSVSAIPYEYMIYATGARHPEPGNLNDYDTKVDAVARLKAMQQKIQQSTKVLLIGGGAVGLELAVEIREHFPEKEVTLVHSREQYMLSYKYGFHEKCVEILNKFGVRQIRGDRCIIPEGGFQDDFEMRKVMTKGGKEIECDLQILCTGMTPQSDLLAKLSPSSINPNNRLVKVKPTLQIADDQFPNIYTAGDVADLEDIKTGGAAWRQSEMCMRNICKMIAAQSGSSATTASGKKATKQAKQDLKLETHSTLPPQILLYFGVAKGVAQLRLFGWMFVTARDFILKRFFTYNILAARAWGWLGLTLSKETADL
ncbi:hypothetical protein BGZ50_006585 [Haplosporangium sp. Z 11]|nr:hypothetical protein BGZ50_006585 [Haplosporangium sp. Z 11]